MGEISSHLINQARNIKNINIDIPLNRYWYCKPKNKSIKISPPIKSIKYFPKKDNFFIIREQSPNIELVDP